MWQSGACQYFNLPMTVNCVVAFVGPTLGFIYANAIRSKGLCFVLCFLLFIWMFASLYGGVIIFHELENKLAMWVIVAAQVLLAILLGFLGWNKMNKMSY
jgi:hypothetical protein